jgi:hypothetical protein
MKSNRLAVVALVLIGMGVVMIAGCGGSKVTKENYDKIKTGMTVAEVEAILGKGTESQGVAGKVGDLAGSAKSITWKDGDKNITVSFLNDKVATVTSSGL